MGQGKKRAQRRYLGMTYKGKIREGNENIREGIVRIGEGWGEHINKRNGKNKVCEIMKIIYQDNV